MISFGSIVAWIKALGFVSKFGGLISLVPGVGPVWGLITTLLGLVISALTYVAKAFWECVLHPVTLVALAITWGFGAFCGIKFDAHLVDVAHTQLRTYVSSAQGAINVEKSRSAAAREVADAAERKAASVVVPPLNCLPTVTSAAPVAKSPGVRNYRSKPAASIFTIPGLPNF